MHPTRWAIAVFAHNEAENIAASLDSLIGAGLGPHDRVVVLANGCRDATEAVVRAYAASHAQVELASIALGDKSNAWNRFVHEYAGRAQAYIFLDGDCLAGAGALPALVSALVAEPQARAAAALPTTGRHGAVTRLRMIEHRDLAGNLYALSADFVDRLRAGGVRLPIGLIGEDSLVGALVKWDLAPGHWREERVVPVPEAGFAFRSLNPRSWHDIRLYFNRRIRYSMRGFQLTMVRALIGEAGLAALPADIRSAYPGLLDRLKPGRRGLDFFFDRLALRRMRAQRPVSDSLGA